MLGIDTKLRQVVIGPITTKLHSTKVLCKYRQTDKYCARDPMHPPPLYLMKICGNSGEKRILTESNNHEEHSNSDVDGFISRHLKQTDSVDKKGLVPVPREPAKRGSTEGCHSHGTTTMVL